MSEAAFVEWARDRAVPLSIPRTDETYDDLAFLEPGLERKRVVLVGESAHYLYEWNRWRARLFKYLVEHHGFTIFALECGVVEGRLVHDYVAGADVEWNEIARAINNVWGVWAEINELLRWMRDWNTRPERSRELRFYPMDGTANWTQAERAYGAVHGFAEAVDSALAADMENALAGGVREISLADRTGVSETRYRELIGAASLVVSRIEQARLSYTASSSRDDYDWALRSAQILRDVLLAIAQTEADFDVGIRQFWNVRDVSMAESLRWIRQREGHDAGIVVGAHNTHLQLHPVRVQRATSMGSYYAAAYGRDDLLFIGTASERSVKGEPPRPDCNQAAYAKVGPDCYFLDLRDAPQTGPVADWLSEERPDRSNLRYQPVCPGAAWDCLLFHRTLNTGTVERPAYLSAEPSEPPSALLPLLEGRYVIRGFLAAVNTLDVYHEDGALYTDGQDDTSGELFPPYRAALHYGADGRFRWAVWPAIIEFHQGDRLGRVTMVTPGGAVYQGERIGEARRA